MSIAEYLLRLKARDIILTSRDGRLLVDAPGGSLTVDDRDTIRQWKDDILLVLSALTPTTASHSDDPDLSGVTLSSAPPVETRPPALLILRSVTLTCPRCGQPSRIRCVYQGRPGYWFAWCDNPGRQCNGKADIVDEADIRRVEAAS